MQARNARPIKTTENGEAVKTVKAAEAGNGASLPAEDGAALPFEGGVAHVPHAAWQEISGLDITLLAGAGVILPVWLAYTFTTTSETLAFVVVVAVIALVAMLTRPFLGLLLFVALLYVRPEEGFPALNGLHLALTTALVTLTGLIGQKVMNREKAIRTPLNGMMMCFGGIVVVSTLGGGQTSDAAQDMLKLIALVLLTLNLVRTRGQYRGLVSAILIFTAYLAFYSIFLYLQGGGVKDHDVMRSKATGIFGDPNDLAAAMDAGLALCLARIARAHWGMRLVYLAMSGLMMWAVLLTNSRGGLLALILMLSVFLLVFTRGKAGALFLAAVIAVGMLKFGPSRMSQMDSSEDSANSRLVFWANGVEHLLQSPLTGVGYGNFPNINGGTTAHNSFVLCFTELGLPGVFCWVGCLYYCFQNAPDPDGRSRIRQQADRAPPSAAGDGEGAARSKPVPPERDVDFYDRNGARLALVGFLGAAFWLSRTYVPNLYLLVSLCVSQQMASHPEITVWKPTPYERKRDWTRIAVFCLVAILIIGILTNRYK